MLVLSGHTRWHPSLAATCCIVDVDILDFRQNFLMLLSLLHLGKCVIHVRTRKIH